MFFRYFINIINKNLNYIYLKKNQKFLDYIHLKKIKIYYSPKKII